MRYLLSLTILAFICNGSEIKNSAFGQLIGKRQIATTSKASLTTPIFVATTTPTAISHSGSNQTFPPSANSTVTVIPSIAIPKRDILDPDTARDIQTIQEHRLSSIIGALSSPNSIPSWLSSLGTDGKWPDSEVDYTTGCAARRANWPAQDHWQRTLVMASAWHGGLQGADLYVKDQDLRNAVGLAMDYWFQRDFTNLACLDSGGTTQCPCDNSDNTLWNTNWFSNIILIPELVGQTCLLLNETLTPTQLGNCTHITGRAYGTFDNNINGVGFLTGANTLDVAKIGVDQALLNLNVTMLQDAYRRIHLELSIRNDVKSDGIRADGSFGQHAGILYNGNYGKDYTNDVVDLEIEAGGTQFAAGIDSQQALATLLDGDRWMIFGNTQTAVLHYDFSALGRFISFPVIDNQATGSIKLNLTEIKELGEQWSLDTVTNFADSLLGNFTNANAGNLTGNKMFYANDYMVHRGQKYVSTLKMYSTRTKNTECTNSQNPFGFHLSDGVLYTYLQGNEYEDISAAWDWDLIAGATIDYKATPLNCSGTSFTGVESFVGGVSNGQIGIAAMRYTNPATNSLHWQKSWFFLEDDIQTTMISGISSHTNATVNSVLDQRRHTDLVQVEGIKTSASTFIEPRSLWHGDVGYTFPDLGNAITLKVQVGEESGNWSDIGTSTQPPSAVDLFAAWIEHDNLTTSVEYTAFPGVSFDQFILKRNQTSLRTIRNDQNISAVYDEWHKTSMIVFWDPSGGSVTLQSAPSDAPITIASNRNAALIYTLRQGSITISDPSQTLRSVNITLSLGLGRKPDLWNDNSTMKIFEVQLPTGGLAGSSVIQPIS